jgi:hypothetical protein
MHTPDTEANPLVTRASGTGSEGAAMGEPGSVEEQNFQPGADAWASRR